MYYLTAGITLIIGGLIFLLLALIFWAISAVGIYFLVFGLIFIFIAVILFLIYNKRRKEEEAERRQKEDEYKLWLKQKGFVVSDITYDFFVDAVNKKWCKKFVEKIFDFKEVTAASINKHRSSCTRTSRYSSSRGARSSSSRRGFYTNSRRGSGSYGSSRSGSSTRASEDTSTYEVLIKTTDIATPVVVIDCYRDKASAEKICATVDIMRGKKTRRTKEDDNGQQSEVTD